MLPNGVSWKERFQKTILPGTIWLLPVNHRLHYLPDVIEYKQNGHFQIRSGDLDKKRYWLADEFQYKSAKSEIVMRAEVRPFLALTGYFATQKMNQIKLPKWYADSIVGFPITKLEHLKDNPDEIKEKFIHIVKKTEQNKLDSDSYIPLSAIMALDIKFFTHKLGRLEGNHLEAVISKLNSFHKGSYP